MPPHRLSLVPPTLAGSDPAEDNPLAPRAIIHQLDAGEHPQAVVQVLVGGREVLFMRLDAAILTEEAVQDMWRHCLAPFAGALMPTSDASPAARPAPAAEAPALRIVGTR